MKKMLVIAALICLGIVITSASGVFAEDCNVTKDGTLYVSPTNLQFYLSQEQMDQPNPITVRIGGYAEAIDDGCSTTTNWGESTDFCWTATKNKQWILFNGSNSSVVSSTSGSGYINVGIDPTQLFPYQDSNTTMVYEGNITIVSNLTNYPTKTIFIKVYVNAVREAGEMSLSTTDWLNLTLNVPIAYNQSGALYILMEHPSLAPGQVFAYRLDEDGNPTFTLFSEWGVPVSGAEELYYAENVQNTPIAIPFSSGSNSYTVPYGVQTLESNSTLSPNIKAYIPVAFGKGLRMVGMEGDMIIRAVVGDPDDIANYDSWKELLYYVVHVYSITGDWVVTENFQGESFTYIDPVTGTVYPLYLREDRGTLSADWQTSTVYPAMGFTLQYANSADQVCNTMAIQGHRFEVTSCAQKGGYDLYFSQNSIFGMMDYYYHINSPENPGEGYIEGTWQWRYSGWPEWSIPETFTAVKNEVEITPDPNDNLYYANGTYNGVGTQFIVDTGASIVTIQGDANEFAAKGWNCDLNTIQEVVAANGGTISGYICYLDITLENRITVEDVPCFVSTSNAMNLLGDTFLSQIHVTIGGDGRMILSR